MYLQTLQMVTRELLGLPMHEYTRKSTIPRDRPKGLFGRPVAHYGVTETSGRLALHTHMLFWGGLQPSMLQDCASYPLIVAAIQEAMTTMYTTTLEPSAHVLSAVRKAAKLRTHFGLDQELPARPPPQPPPEEEETAAEKKKRLSVELAAEHGDAAEPAAEVAAAGGGDGGGGSASSSGEERPAADGQSPPPCRRAPNPAWARRRGDCCAVEANSHSTCHNPSCYKAPAGDLGCRFCMPCGHGCPAGVGVVLLKDREQVPSQDGKSPATPGSRAPGAWVLPGQDPDGEGGWRCQYCGQKEQCQAEDADGKLDVFKSTTDADGKKEEGIERAPRHDRRNPDTPIRPKDSRATAYEMCRPASERLPMACESEKERQEFEDAITALRADQQVPPELVLRVSKAVLSEAELEEKYAEWYPGLAAALRALEQDPLKAKEFLKLLTNFQCSDAWVVQFNQLLMNFTGWNQAPLFLGGMEQAKAALFYLVKYMTKDNTALTAALSVLVEAERNVRVFPSVAEDSGTSKRTAQHFLTRVINSLSAKQELADSQAALLLLGQSNQFCSHGTAFMNVWDAMQKADEAAEVTAARGEEEAEEAERADNTADDDDDDAAAALEDDDDGDDSMVEDVDGAEETDESDDEEEEYDDDDVDDDDEPEEEQARCCC